MRIPSLRLPDGTEVPQIGLGTYKVHGEDAVRIVRAGIEAGYRHIDTASFYDNEEEVGRGIRQAIAAGDVAREELFIATKLWNDEQGAANVRPALERSLRRLGLDYLDLYLLHWPCPRQGLYNETFAAMGVLREEGVVRRVGVCNFYEEVLDDLIETTDIVPVLNQVEMHVGFSQRELLAEHRRRGILTEAWAPLGRASAFDHPTVAAIAQAHEAAPAQVLLRYLLDLGVSVIPKTSRPQRLVDNLGALDVELSEAEREQLAGLDEADGFGRLSGDPRTFPAEDAPGSA